MKARYNIATDKLKKVFEKTMGKCFYCGIELPKDTIFLDDGGKEVSRHRNWHVDHVVPFSRGGTYELINLVPACSDCNLKKSDKGLFNWGNEFCDPETGERTGFFYFELMRLPVPTAWDDPL